MKRPCSVLSKRICLLEVLSKDIPTLSNLMHVNVNMEIYKRPELEMHENMHFY